MMLQQGDTAPDFSLACTGGQTIDRAGLKGRKAVLYFYPKDDTSGCTREAKEFSDLRGAFEAADTEIVGISADDLKSHDRFKGTSNNCTI